MKETGNQGGEEGGREGRRWTVECNTMMGNEGKKKDEGRGVFEGQEEGRRTVKNKK